MALTLTLVVPQFEARIRLSGGSEPGVQGWSFLFWGKGQSTREKKELRTFGKHEFLVTCVD